MTIDVLLKKCKVMGKSCFICALVDACMFVVEPEEVRIGEETS